MSKIHQNGRKQILIRAFLGGSDGNQVQPFNSAISTIAAKHPEIILETLDVNQVKKLFSSPDQLIDWLIQSDIHFILSHLHQGLSQLNWSMTNLYSQALRLAIHCGFPNGKYLRCPIFSQDKYKYISAIPEFFNPTLSIPLIDHNYELDCNIAR
jgi:hypothetical protein